MSDQNLRIIIDALFRGKGEVDEASRKIKGLEKDTKGAGEASKESTKQMSAMAAMLKTAVVGAAISAGYAVVQFTRQSIAMASSVEEMQAKFDTVFGAHALAAEQNLSTLADTIGRSKFELMGYAATLQDTFVPLGFARDSAADMSLTLVALAEDMASFNNLPTRDVVRDIQSAIVGNTETLRKYGVVAQETQIKQEALNSGLWDGTGVIDAQSKAQAILQLIIKGTTDAQGDAERTAGSYANQQRALEAAMMDLQVTIGNDLLPTMTELTTQTAELVRWTNQNWDAIKKAVEQTRRWHMAISSLGATELISWLKDFTEEAKDNAVSVEDLAIATVKAGGSYEDFRKEAVKLGDHMGINTRKQWEAAEAAVALGKAVDEASGFDRNFRQSVERTIPAVDDLAEAFIDASSEAAELMGGYDDLVVKGARAREVALAKAEATEAAAEADRIAAEAARDLARETGNAFMAALEGTPIQDDLGAAIIRGGQAAGLSAEKMAILTGQFGDYSDEAIEAALKSALIEQKIKELVTEFGNGEMSVSQLRAELQRYIDKINEVPDAVTTNVHTNYSQSGPVPQWPAGVTPPANPNAPTPFALGGRVRGGQRGRDSVRALLMPDEIVLPVHATGDMSAAVDFLSKHIPGGGGGGVTIEAGAIVINAGAGMNEYTIAQQVVEGINREIGRRADNRMRA